MGGVGAGFYHFFVALKYLGEPAPTAMIDHFFLLPSSLFLLPYQWRYAIVTPPPPSA
ncbi:MAG: hypothetical protein ACRCT1_19875 [Microcoleaceae cyanobacterium]